MIVNAKTKQNAPRERKPSLGRYLEILKKNHINCGSPVGLSAGVCYLVKTQLLRFDDF